ncbi:caspase recruitment domain-containing protein 8-like isoform X2 [Pseudochaenichthys georgianus]|uniref:caspase recruitment domain-containing protein 8-like isoform X2 n=1 Tax=Pseudochaenichthys georgianus TaxID=52239 RepID=UPI00146A86B9|nr:NACHT, LRR and PYD domains-containing protein 1b allele 3-like isoform X2 [Pseudochaenichthys georgianus]
MSSDALKYTLLKLSPSHLRWFCRRLAWWSSSSRPNWSDATFDISEITDFMVSTYTEDGALSKAANILRMMDCNDEADTLEPKEKHIMDMLRNQLIHDVTDVESVLDELITKGVIHQESYDKICALPTSEEKMKELLDGHLKSEEDKDICYRIVEKWIPHFQSASPAVYSESVDKLGSGGPPKVVRRKTTKIKMPTVVQVPEVHWITLKPEVICVDDEDTPIYSLQSDAGPFECGVSGLRWVCKEKVSLKYQFGSWEEHMERMEALHFIPGGPLLDVTVIAGKLEEAYLPHWICTEDNPEVLGKFSVLHIDTCGDVVEPVSEVTPSHVKLSQPHFSPRGVLMRAGFRIKINCKVLIFKTNLAFLTLHVYLIPSDPALQQTIKSKELSSGYKMIKKPYPQKSLKMGKYFTLKANLDSAEITPENLKLVYEGSDPNFCEVFIENPDSNFKLTLAHKSAPVWTCVIRKEEELARMRPELVRNMSRELINQLLDDLLMDGVLNDGEKDSVLQENDTTADRARCLIDMVKRKGRAASRKIICHIQSRDPTLSADLGLHV